MRNQMTNNKLNHMGTYKVNQTSNNKVNAFPICAHAVQINFRSKKLHNQIFCQSKTLREEKNPLHDQALVASQDAIHNQNQYLTANDSCQIFSDSNFKFQKSQTLQENKFNKLRTSLYRRLTAKKKTRLNQRNKQKTEIPTIIDCEKQSSKKRLQKLLSQREENKNSINHQKDSYFNEGDRNINKRKIKQNKKELSDLIERSFQTIMEEKLLNKRYFHQTRAQDNQQKLLKALSKEDNLKAFIPLRYQEVFEKDVPPRKELKVHQHKSKQFRPEFSSSLKHRQNIHTNYRTLDYVESKMKKQENIKGWDDIDVFNSQRNGIIEYAYNAQTEY